MAQTIHDRVGHTISGSLIQLEAAKLLISKEQHRAEKIVQNVITLLREGMENIRATLHNIKPPVEQLGVNRLKLLLDEFTANHSIETILICSGNIERISARQWKVIGENTSEALTNALKYSQAKVIRLSIQVLNTMVKAEIKDDGAGARVLKKGLGIRGMEERSGNLGGKMIIDGSQGFSVITLLPLEGENNGD